jgi:GrpB-like predicted nucleotidyltransferase (UPF0157 family)
MSSVDETVELRAYDARWPRLFESEAADIRAVLGNAALGIEHIGSTAVPGLPAKPIVDVMLGVADLDESEELSGRLVSLGYEDCGRVGGRRHLRKRDDDACNVQIVEHDGALWKANLLLRDYLRAEPEAVGRYAEAKRRAMTRAAMLLAYSELKSAAIEDLLQAATAWQRTRSSD